MKIALIGTHGIGKTTAVLDITTELKKRGRNATMLLEQTAFCPFEINQNTSIKAQKYILTHMIQNELVLEEKFSYVICDRSALDALIYAIYSLGYEKVKSWEGFVLDHLSTYDFLFKLPIKKEYLKEDGVRAVETEYQLAIDNIFENYLEEKKIDHIKLSPEEDYAKQVLKHMNIEKI